MKDKLNILIKWIGNQLHFNIKRIWSDNGLEFCDRNVTELLEDHGIQHQKPIPYTPEHNGSAEKDTRTLMKIARTMIYAISLDIRLWVETIHAAVYILNRTGPDGCDDKSRFELFFDEKSKLKSLSHQIIKKLDPKSKEGIFVGHSDNMKGFRIW